MMNLALSNDSAGKEEKYIRSFIDRKVDGLIVFPVNKDGMPVRKAIQQNIPTVLILNDILDIDANVVKIDDYNAISNTVQYLIDLGHKKIAYIDGYLQYSLRYNTAINDERCKAFRDTMIKNHLMYEKDNYIEFSPLFYETKDYSLLKNLMDREHKPTALVCFHDRIAIWAMQGLKRLGMRVPQDISITGFDNINELQYIEPALTTNRMPTIDIAQQAVSILVEDIENQISGNKKMVLSTEFIVGDSCKQLK